MKIRTISDLSTALRTDLGWRRKETSVLKGLVVASESSKQQALLRGAVAVLYAHWEGFLKHASRTYLGYVRLKRTNLNELAPCFAAMAARGRLNSLSQSNRVALQIQFVDWWSQEWGRRATLPGDSAIDVKGNVTVDVFQDLIHRLGLPYRAEYSIREKPIIERLVDVRNKLAHGEWKNVALQEYVELQEKIDEMMAWVCDDIETSASKRGYRRPGA